MKINFIDMCTPNYVGMTGFLPFHIIPSLQLIESKTTWSIQAGLFYYIVDLTWNKRK